ncbi:MAG: tetratricopeptide repeat protein [Anaerolineae bacterium]
MTDTELKGLLHAGIAAARAGDKGQARRLLLQVIEQDEEVEAAWLWLSDVVEDPAERQICLENVLTLNPDNQAARAGLRWLQELPQAEAAPPPAPATGPTFARPSSGPGPAPPAAPAAPPSSPGPTLDPPPALELDPFGCPYCGGTIRAEEPRCLDCGRTTIRRYRKRQSDAWLGWLVFCFLLLAVTSALEGRLAGQAMAMEPFPGVLNETALRFLVGSALTAPEGLSAQLVELAGVLSLANYLLAGLCLAAAAGLAMRSRLAYFGSFLLGGVLVVTTGTGLLAGLSGWIPSLLRLGLIAVSVKWLADIAPAFEWQTRAYHADVDNDLRTDMDYYNRGQRYREMGMWAKAAAHWKVAAQMAPDRPTYRGHLARAYLQMGYPAAALAEVERALARVPDDEELLAFRASLIETGGEA